MRRTKEDSEATKQQILSSALEVFSELGYQKAQLNEIADRAGVTRGAIYWHFKNKEDLFINLINGVSTKSQEIMMKVISQGSSFTEICKGILVEQWQLLEEDIEYKKVMKLVLLKAGDFEGISDLKTQQMTSDRALIDQVTQFMSMGIEQGVLRKDLDPIAAAHGYLSIQKGFAMNWLLMEEVFSIKDLAERVADSFIKGLV